MSSDGRSVSVAGFPTNVEPPAPERRLRARAEPGFPGGAETVANRVGGR